MLVGIKIKPKKKKQKPTCRRGLFAPKSFKMFASVVLRNVSVSIDKESKQKISITSNSMLALSVIA